MVDLFEQTRFAGRLMSAAIAIAVVAAPSASFAQANIHNDEPDGTPIVLNTPQNANATASGTLEDRGADAADTIDYNTANFDFEYSLFGGGEWVGGIQYQVDSGDQQIWAQPANVNFNQGREARYTVRLSRCVAGLTFTRGGLDNNDDDIVTASFNGSPVPLLNSYFDSFTGGLNIVSNNGTEVRLNGPSSGSGTENQRQYRFIVPSSVLIDTILVRSAKSDTRTSNVTTAFYDFNWDAFQISATNDSVTGVNGTTGQSAVLSILSNDDLGNPCTPAVDTPTSGTVTITPVGAVPAGLTLNADGTVDVAPGTAADTYVFDYQICENANPTNCTTATISVEVIVATTSDLSLTKTNTPGVNNEIDQAADTVTAGSSTSYTITVTNNGPDPVSGAIVTDTPISGLTCLGTNVVSITGDGVPAGSFTVADLTGSGITLGTIPNNGSTVLSFSCAVN